MGHQYTPADTHHATIWMPDDTVDLRTAANQNVPDEGCADNANWAYNRIGELWEVASTAPASTSYNELGTNTTNDFDDCVVTTALLDGTSCPVLLNDIVDVSVSFHGNTSYSGTQIVVFGLALRTYTGVTPHDNLVIATAEDNDMQGNFKPYSLVGRYTVTTAGNLAAFLICKWGIVPGGAPTCRVAGTYSSIIRVMRATGK